jgi:S-adenosyl-L-methionine hydrolase (adenosine-forming)
VTRRRGDTETRRHDDKTLVRVAASLRPRVPLITLLTDFGTADYFVAAVKGVILSLNPRARIVDISHDIPPQDIEAAAFTLLAAQPAFAAGTIHVGVVDPGVGSTRRAILIHARESFFVGPDNGIFSYVCESDMLSGQRNSSSPPEVFHLTNTEYFRHPVSDTFNGRDVFAPVAAALSRGVKPAELGTQITDFVRLAPLVPTTSRDGRITARVIHIDRFGNCVTNITPNDLPAKMIQGGAKLRLKGKLVKSFRRYFSEETGSRDKLFAVWGSAGFLEIAATNESAAKLLKARCGDAVIVSEGSSSR